MRIGVIGCGSIGSRHARNAKALGHDVSSFDSDAERAFELAVELHGDPKVAAFCPTDNWQMFGKNDHFDAVLICTPAHTHTSVLLQLRDAGYIGPLFVEKPICDTLVDARYFLDWPNPVRMVGYQLRFHPQAKALKNIIHRALVGNFRIECDMRMWPGLAYGPAILECSHELDLALWCGLSNLRSATMTEHAAALRFENGRVDLDGRASRYWREWNGTNGTLGYQCAFDSPEELGEQMYVDELAHFLRCAETGSPVAPGCTFEEGIRVLEIIEAARRMAR